MKKKGTRLAVLASVGPYAAETLLLVVLPLLYVCLMSIMTRPSYGGVEFTVSFNGYKAMFEKAYLVAIWNSVRMSLVSTVIILLVSYPMAYMLSRCSRRVASNLIILMMIPYFTNSLIRLYSYITLFNTKGILTGILDRLGMTWSADFLYSESAVVLGLVYVCIPYAVLPMYSSIERLDKALLEASYDLGAGRVKTFFRITLPMTMPGVYAAAIISFVPSIGNYFVADVLGGSKTLLIGNLIKDQFMSSRNWPLGSALSVFLIAGTMILVYLYARVSRADVMEGGL
ncbi:MAG: ABC transporter permease [Oscillospiraceae bacterium]|jgi:spermidine/putrescine transport system permease protein|nr:ABC transporter permease [Oscillospiraceae bacterium]